MSIRLEKENGMPVARIARRYGISRQSVYNVVNGVSGGVRERVPRPSLLDPFKPHLRARLARFDLPATVLLREIQQQGYAGGISILKAFVAGVKTDFVRAVIERFETLPGVQAQIDWGECGTIVEHGVSRRLYLFVFVLGFSRVTFARFTTSMRQPELLSCTREAFEAWGVPQELLVDNMKTAVDRHLVGEEVRFNAGFLGFCEHYGSLPVARPGPYGLDSCPPLLRCTQAVALGVRTPELRTCRATGTSPCPSPAYTASGVLRPRLACRRLLL